MKPFEFLSGLPKQFGLRGVLHKGKLSDNEFVFYAMLYAGKKALLEARQKFVLHDAEQAKLYLDRLLTRCVTKSAIQNIEKKKTDKPKEFEADKYNQEMLEDFKFWRQTWEGMALSCSNKDFLQEIKQLEDLDKVVKRFDYWMGLLDKKREGVFFE